MFSVGLCKETGKADAGLSAEAGATQVPAAGPRQLVPEFVLGALELRGVRAQSACVCSRLGGGIAGALCAPAQLPGWTCKNSHHLAEFKETLTSVVPIIPKIRSGSPSRFKSATASTYPAPGS